MKKLLLFLLLLQQLNTNAQRTQEQIEAMKNPKFTYGYVDGIRLDSINTKYAQVEFNDEYKWASFKY